jgi:hypothetical protein
MAIDKIIKSNRLLQSRRYTVASLSDAQESFTSVLDINSKEVYAQASLLPTSSLPFSGSSQDGSIYSVGNQNLLKYWYQHQLTPSAVQSSSRVDAWFFINPYPGGDVTPQLIASGQQTNFISNKYAVPTLTNADAQDSPPGYNVTVLRNGEKQNPADYQFDYKNGVLQFLSTAPSPTDIIRITAYQYIGQTVDTILTNFSSSIGNLSSSLNNVSTYQITTGSISASLSLNPTKAFAVTSASVSLLNIHSDNKEVSVINLYVSGNFTVQGTASFQNTENLLISDRFVLFASGATAAGDGGIVVQQDSQGFGQLFGYDSDTTRWGFTSSFNPATASAFTPVVYVGAVQVGTGQPAGSTAPIYGGSTNGYGTIHIDTEDSEIWIYA